jgi:ATP-dependent DNA ligase
MALPVKPPFHPMEAQPVERLPEGPDWQYEPKWDGFRCLVFRDAKRTELQSKSGRPFTRYFPDLVSAIAAVRARRFVLDGEIVVSLDNALSFDALLQRIHPAESRVRKLASETPAALIVFDLLVDENGASLLRYPLEERRRRLEQFFARHLSGSDTFTLSPLTLSSKEALRWLRDGGIGLDGVIAKRRELAYRSDDRSGMQKVKNFRSADCVVGGFRYGTNSDLVGSLLLGLYDREGKLNHVGFTATIYNDERKELTKRLEKLIAPPGFTGDAPGGPSRWSTKRSTEWQPLRPKLVVEVCYDHFSGGRFRHGTRLLRWRPDKRPNQCTYDQIPRAARLPPSFGRRKGRRARTSRRPLAVRKTKHARGR